MKDFIAKKMHEYEKKFNELCKKLAQPEIIQDHNVYLKYSRQKAKLEPLLTGWRQYQELKKQLADVLAMYQEEKDPKMCDFLQEEKEKLLEALKEKEQELELKLFNIIMPQEDYCNLIIEIRAGTGGLEACLFAADLYKMYRKFAQKKGWKTEVINFHDTSLGGFKEIIFSISGQGAYRYLKYESGVHRVQRVPETETGGRIHTSAVSVVVLPEPDEVEVKIDPKDLKIETFRASGPGGQYVNVTDSAVRITHLPTGIVVSCQDERSQIKNREKALRVLKARLLDLKKREQEKELSEKRKKFIGSGDRSEKIRTYNFLEKRVTDHRIGLTLYKLDEILEGELDQLLEAIMVEERKAALKHYHG